MAKPDWYIVLEAIYEEDGRVETSDKPESNKVTMPNNDFWEDVELSDIEMVDAISYLLDAGLLDEGLNGIGLTNDGFKIVSQRKEAGTQTQLNRSLVGLTLILAISAFTQTLVSVESVLTPGFLSDNNTILALLIGFQASLLILILVAVYRKSLLDFEF